MAAERLVARGRGRGRGAVLKDRVGDGPVAGGAPVVMEPERAEVYLVGLLVPGEVDEEVDRARGALSEDLDQEGFCAGEGPGSPSDLREEEGVD